MLSAGPVPIAACQRGSGVAVRKRDHDLGDVELGLLNDGSADPPLIFLRLPPAAIDGRQNQGGTGLWTYRHRSSEERLVDSCSHIIERSTPVAGIDADRRGDISPSDPDLPLESGEMRRCGCHLCHLDLPSKLRDGSYQSPTLPSR